MKEFRDHNDASRYYAKACISKLEAIMRQLREMQRTSIYSKDAEFDKLRALERELESLNSTFWHNMIEYKKRRG